MTSLLVVELHEPIYLRLQFSAHTGPHTSLQGCIQLDLSFNCVSKSSPKLPPVTFEGERSDSFGYQPVDELSDDICKASALALYVVMTDVIGMATALATTSALAKSPVRIERAIREEAGLTFRLCGSRGIADEVLSKLHLVLAAQACGQLRPVAAVRDHDVVADIRT